MSQPPRPPADEAPPARGLLLYDGGCALCRRSVRLLLALDRRGALRFAPLGGDTARGLLGGGREAGEADSVVFLPLAGLRTGRPLFHSAALIGALAAVGAPGPLAARALSLLPARLRDALYGAVARRRRRDPARAARCPLPSPGESSRFLP